jgi:hypothetical protein
LWLHIAVVGGSALAEKPNETIAATNRAFETNRRDLVCIASSVPRVGASGWSQSRRSGAARSSAARRDALGRAAGPEAGHAA